MSLFFRTLTLMLLILSKAPAYAAIQQEVSENGVKAKASQNQLNPKLFKHSLSGLYGIEPTYNKVIQPYDDFETLYSKAQKAQTELDSVCKNAALLSKTKPEFPGVKSKARAQKKIEIELDGKVNQITDLARASIVADDIEGLVTAYEVIERLTNIVKVKNRFKTPAPSGYRDLNLLVQLPESGMIAEVQLHLKTIAEIKSGPEHELYEIIQGIERKVALENRVLTELEIAQLTKIRHQSQQMYHDAWLPYITTKIKAAS